jgi:hypothetical protein
MNHIVPVIEGLCILGIAAIIIMVIVKFVKCCEGDRDAD